MIKAALKENREVYGLVNSVPVPMLVEMMAYADYDFVIIDLEHLFRDPTELEHAIRAAESSKITPFVRVPIDSPYLIKHALDAGAHGIVIPQVNNKKQAEVAVKACYYPPLGTRGITGGKNTGFGRLPISEYVAQANNEVMLTVMIESKEGVENLDDILSVKGIDMVLEGALDLAVSLGHGQDMQHHDVQSGINLTAELCIKYGITFCALPRANGQIDKWRAQGIKAFVAGQDRGIIFRALQKNLTQLKTQ